MADPAEAPPGPPISDQQVIDAVVSNDHATMAGLARQLGGRSALQARARSLGLTAAFVKQTRMSNASASMRGCLKCDARFLSSGTHNRLCRKCSGS